MGLAAWFVEKHGRHRACEFSTLNFFSSHLELLGYQDALINRRKLWMSNCRHRHRQAARQGSDCEQRQCLLLPGFESGRSYSYGRWSQAGGVLQALCPLFPVGLIDHPRVQAAQPLDLKWTPKSGQT